MEIIQSEMNLFFSGRHQNRKNFLNAVDLQKRFLKNENGDFRKKELPIILGKMHKNYINKILEYL